MSWLASFESALPDHCAPQTDFLLSFSSAFHVCIPTPLAFASNLLGVCSIISWLFAQLPQIYKNWSIQSTSGLSVFFLVIWLLGDLSNLFGALFTHQASWQVTIGSYYVFVDLCLVGQWVWFERLRHGHSVFRVWKKSGNHLGNNNNGGDDGPIVIEGIPVSLSGEEELNDSDIVHEGEDPSKPPPSRPKIIFRTPTFTREANKDEKASPRSSSAKSNTILRTGPGSSSPIPSPSPRTVLLIACLLALAQASPLHHTIHSSSPTTVLFSSSHPTPLESLGTLLSWSSTTLYLASRLPQLYKNHVLKSTAGLSPHLFLAAFFGNLFYSAALLTNPSLWADLAPYGGRGWAGPQGTKRLEWGLAALPFFLGAAGVLGMDAAVGVQFWVYGDGGGEIVVLKRQREGREGQGAWRPWRRVSGWMRGWVPGGGTDVGVAGERAGLLGGRAGEGGVGSYGLYGAVGG